MNEWAHATGLDDLASKIAVEFSTRQIRLVLAESCTGGLASALLTSVPGASNWFCGSLVTYRSKAKVEWIGVPFPVAEVDSGVGQETSNTMALAAMVNTSEADWSAAITGHLGPNAPEKLDGQVYVALARRKEGRRELTYQQFVALPPSSRQQRQVSAVQFLFDAILHQIRS